MSNKKLVIFAAVTLAVLALAGWGCGQGYSVSNWETDTAGGGETYQSDEWGVSFTYPTGWQYHEYRETIEGEELVTLAFSDQELPEALPPEPSFPVMVFHGEGTIEDAMSDYADAVSVADVTIGSRMAKRVVYYSDFLGQNDVVYLVPLRRGFLRFFVPEGTSHVSVAEDMIGTIGEME